MPICLGSLAYVALAAYSNDFAQGLWAVGVVSALIIAATQVDMVLILRVNILAVCSRADSAVVRAQHH